MVGCKVKGGVALLAKAFSSCLMISDVEVWSLAVVLGRCLAGDVLEEEVPPMWEFDLDFDFA
jgi:hypothetical protein